MSTSAPRSVVSELRARIARLEGRAAHQRAVLPFGLPAIDRILPEGGLLRGALHEVAGGGTGAVNGAAAALFAAGVAARSGGKVLWCVTRPDLFAPALAQAGLAPGRVVYVECG
ncbi:MAG: damage-inducible protein, partial [Bosea sp. (in: a-proteobacteria)]|nr:damage-inducible protein [Bosea sp. (in: a-proteobacteria)]